MLIQYFRESSTEIKFYTYCILVGIVSGLGAIFFRELIAFFHNLLFYGIFSTDYNVLIHTAASRWGAGVILVPVIGAVFVAYLVKNFAIEAKGHGVPEVIDAIYYRNGMIRPIVAVVKALASSICIGSGGSVGREGPIIQIGSSFGSAIAQWSSVATWERITLIACGAAGGIAATFNAPLGGVLFAVEVILPEVSVRTVIPVLLTTVIATYVSYFYFGNEPFLPLSSTGIFSIDAVGTAYVILFSILLGIISAVFIHSIYYAEDMFERLPGGYYLQHMLGMALVGLSLYLMMKNFGHYYVEGVGYATVFEILTNTLINPAFLFFLCALKILDTALTLGSGGSGGIFSPSLFIGATFGGAFASLSQHYFPDHTMMNVTFGALAGMAGMVGATTAAPLTAIIMTAELINDYNVVLPMMFVVAICYGVRRLIMKDSVYTLKLSRRGHIIPEALITKVGVMK